MRQLKCDENSRKIASMPDSRSEELLARIQDVFRISESERLLTDPVKEAMTELLRTSAARLRAEGASVLVRNADSGDLQFLAATGEVADRIVGLEIPAGKGIAGFVLMSGQPLAVSEPDDESGFYAEVDKTTGFSTKLLLAVPLRFRDDVIGVLEYVNRSDEPLNEPFTPAEMDAAAVYAEAVAALVNAHIDADLMCDLSRRLIQDGTEAADIRAWLLSLRENSTHARALELAALVSELASKGDAEVELCRTLLESLIGYSTSTTGRLDLA